MRFQIPALLESITVRNLYPTASRVSLIEGAGRWCHSISRAGRRRIYIIYSRSERPGNQGVGSQQPARMSTNMAWVMRIECKMELTMYHSL